MTSSTPNLIIPFAKPSGITSFSSLWQIKHVLETKKVGHTGTLDSFADGLLVLLSGKFTKLAPYITDCSKTYKVWCSFGKETDTLDPGGNITASKALPFAQDFLTVLKQFHGNLEQIPPLYSAIKQDGQRLSDKIRRGEAICVKPRPIYIYNIQVEKLFYADQDQNRLAAASLSVHCSKGTYIRSLIRDIAYACNTVAYVQALRRTALGPFSLDQALGNDLLRAFENNAAIQDVQLVQKVTKEAVMDAAFTLNKQTCAYLHFQSVAIIESYYNSFVTGKKIAPSWFENSDMLIEKKPIAVFYRQKCVGLIKKHTYFYSYIAVFS